MEINNEESVIPDISSIRPNVQRRGEVVALSARGDLVVIRTSQGARVGFWPRAECLSHKKFSLGFPIDSPR